MTGAAGQSTAELSLQLTDFENEGEIEHEFDWGTIGRKRTPSVKGAPNIPNFVFRSVFLL
jgi:hypothetical protein